MTTVLSQQRDSRQSTAHIEYELTRPPSPFMWVSVAGVTFVALAALRRRRGVRPRAFAREAAGVH